MADLGGDGVQIGDGTDTGDIAALITQHRTDIDAVDSVTGAVSVASIAALTALPKSGLTDDDYAIVKGYYAPGDGGGGTFQWDAASTATTNLGLCFAADEGGTGRWIRDRRGHDALNILWFGAKMDEVTDDTAAIQAAIDLRRGAVFIPAERNPASRGTPVTQLQIYVGTHIFGVSSGNYGNNGSRLFQVDGENKSMIVPHSSIPTSGWMHNVYLHDFMLEGRSVNSTSGPGGTSTVGCGIDINIKLGETFMCERMQFRQFPESGVRITRGTTPGGFRDLSSFQNDLYGFDFQATESGAVWHQFHAENLSGDDNGIALIRVKSMGQKYDMVNIRNVKSECNRAGRQQYCIELDTLNGCPVNISEVSHVNIGVTSAAVIRNTSTAACRIIADYLRTDNNTTNWIQDDYASKNYAKTSTAGSDFLSYSIWDGGVNNPEIHMKTRDTHYNVDRLNQVGTAAPTTGTHYRGEIVYNTEPSASGTVGWVCVTAGTPGTWKTFGAISA